MSPVGDGSPSTVVAVARTAEPSAARPRWLVVNASHMLRDRSAGCRPAYRRQESGSQRVNPGALLMAIDQQELARRLRKLRESCNMTQVAVAKHLGVARSAVTEIETGRRSVSGLELHRLAYLYARDLEELLADEFVEREPITALFRRHHDTTVNEATLDALRRCVVLGREVVNLEGRLGIRRESLGTPSYSLPRPDTKWEAVRQGSHAAGDERRRLDLGVAPLPDVAELLEDQGIVTAQEKLPDDVSGLTLIDPGVASSPRLMSTIMSSDAGFPSRTNTLMCCSTAREGERSAGRANGTILRRFALTPSPRPFSCRRRASAP